MGYVHWTFPDQTVEDQYPSYLMARRVRPLGDGVLRTTADDAVNTLKGVAEAASAAELFGGEPLRSLPEFLQECALPHLAATLSK